ncbi:hypothetical protein P4O66_020303, partial [Electrophorus voltai]
LSQYRNTDRQRMPGAKNKKKKEKKKHNRSYPALAENPSILLGTLPAITMREHSAPGEFLWGPECGPGLDSAESYRPLSDYRNWYDDQLEIHQWRWRRPSMRIFPLF